MGFFGICSTIGTKFYQNSTGVQIPLIEPMLIKQGFMLPATKLVYTEITAMKSKIIN